MSEHLAQSPDELFDVTTYDGRPTGVVKRRADVHRDGDWHAAIHVWVVRIGVDGPELLFQQRSLAKDTHPGKLDATVGGHLNAGETIAEAVRECEEEIGATYRLEDLVYLGRRIAVGERLPELADREVQQVFLARDTRPLGQFRPHPIELAALVAFPIEPLLDLLGGYADTAPGTFLLVPGGDVVRREVARDEFAAIADRYYYRVALAARAYLSGERHFTV